MFLQSISHLHLRNDKGIGATTTRPHSYFLRTKCISPEPPYRRHEKTIHDEREADQNIESCEPALPQRGTFII